MKQKRVASLPQGLAHASNSKTMIFENGKTNTAGCENINREKKIKRLEK